MPWSFPVEYTCQTCHKAFWSTHYKQPSGCPECRRIKRSAQILANYHQRRAEGRQSNHHGGRDPSYDGTRMGAPPSVYSSSCVIHLRREVARCQCCGKVTDIVNGYCALCRGVGANEQQCDNAEGIR